MSNFKLRSLRPADLDRVAEIEGRLFGSPRKAFFERLLAIVTANPDTFITCGVEDGGNLKGYGFARIQHGEFGSNKNIAVLNDIGVDPDAQRKGIGKAILACIEQQMKEKRIDNLKTMVLWSDSALTKFFCGNGFRLTSKQVIERDTSTLKEDVAEVATVKMDSRWQVHSEPGCDHYERLARDRVFVRSYRADDLPSVIRIDGKLTGQERPAYFETKSREMLEESGVRVSLVAEDNGIVTGYIMARVDFGEFGQVDSEAAIDTIGVHPAYKGSGVGHALLSQLLLNLSTLKVEKVRTQVQWENFGLQRFLFGCGFGPSQRLILAKTIK